MSTEGRLGGGDDDGDKMGHEDGSGWGSGDISEIAVRYGLRVRVGLGCIAICGACHNGNCSDRHNQQWEMDSNETTEAAVHPQEKCLHPSIAAEPELVELRGAGGRRRRGQRRQYYYSKD